MKTPSVVFVTTSFGNVSNGPDTYAKYLWEAFCDDSELDFHLVIPDDSNGINHPKVHMSKPMTGSLGLYKSLADKAIEVAGTLGPKTIIHCNHCHLSTKLLKAGNPVWGQINDMANVELTRDWFSVLKRNGPRRVAALARRRAIERAMVRNQQKTICNSKATRAAILNGYRPPHPKRVVTLYKAVDIGFFSHTTNKARSDKPKAVFLGHDFVTKGLDTVIEAFIRLDQTMPLTIVGTTLEQYLQKFPEHQDFLAKTTEITFAGHGNRDKVRDFLHDADLLILPSRTEALGVAILEALASRCYVIASNVGGIPEILDGLSCGTMVPPAQTDALRDEISGFIENRPDLQALAWEGVQDRLAMFSKDRMLADLKQLYLAN